MDTEVEVVNSQSNLAGDPSATTKSLGGLVNAGGRERELVHVVQRVLGVSCDDIINNFCVDLTVQYRLTLSDFIHRNIMRIPTHCNEDLTYLTVGRTRNP
jgi:hypothetical protein